MTISLSLSVEQMKVLDAALQELPFKVAAPLIAEINRQIAPQLSQTPDESSSDGGPAQSNPD